MRLMIPRLIKLPAKQNFILFGARGTGKSTLIKKQFNHEKSIYINLLLPDEEERFVRSPSELIAITKALPEKTTHVIIDEIQKIPKLLSVVHELIESTSKKFIMTGSSARKLKHNSADLLAGRAFVFNLFPFSYLELKDQFNLDHALQWGMLPGIYALDNGEEKLQFLQAYAYTYLKEEVWAEQIIRSLDPFRRFLEVAAQCNGKIINYSNIARDVGVDDKTIKEYFIILEDTLMGFFLEPYVSSFRKRLSQKPKFYLFDTGVTRALARSLSLPLQPRTSAYGDSFEHFVILECIKLASYFYPEYRFSYLKTKDDAEIDLVVERPGEPTLLIEIKSSFSVKEEDLSTLKRFQNDFNKSEAVCFSNDERRKCYNEITVIPWHEGIKQYFSKSGTIG